MRPLGYASTLLRKARIPTDLVAIYHLLALQASTEPFGRRVFTTRILFVVVGKASENRRRAGPPISKLVGNIGMRGP
jgi:hypothetical protein